MRSWRAPRHCVSSARTGIGYDGVDVAAATRRGIAVCNTPDGPTISTAEHAVTLMLLVAKRVDRAAAALRTGTASGYYSRHTRHRARRKGPGPCRIRPDRQARGTDRGRTRDAGHGVRSVPCRRGHPGRDRTRRHPRHAPRGGRRRLRPRPVDRGLARHVRRGRLRVDEARRRVHQHGPWRAGRPGGVARGPR